MSRTKRVGPRMRNVVEYVRRNPGRAMIHAASWVGPNGSLMYGYQTVKRAIAAGLVRQERGPCNSYLLFPVEPRP